MAHSEYHLTVPADLAGTSVAAELQTRATAFNDAVDAGGRNSADAIACAKAFEEKWNEALAEVGVDFNMPVA